MKPHGEPVYMPGHPDASRNFSLHGSTFSKYELERTRKNHVLRNVLVKHLYQNGTLKNVADAFELLKKDDSVAIQTVVHHLTQNAADVYTNLIHTKENNLNNFYGITVQNGCLTQNTSSIHQNIKKRRPKPKTRTIEEEQLLQRLISKYANIDRSRLPNLCCSHTMIVSEEQQTLLIQPIQPTSFGHVAAEDYFDNDEFIEQFADETLLQSYSKAKDSVNPTLYSLYSFTTSGEQSNYHFPTNITSMQ